MGELIEKLNCCGGGPPKRTLQIKKKWKIDEINFDFLLFCCASRGGLAEWCVVGLFLCGLWAGPPANAPQREKTSQNTNQTSSFSFYYLWNGIINLFCWSGNGNKSKLMKEWKHIAKHWGREQSVMRVRYKFRIFLNTWRATSCLRASAFFFVRWNVMELSKEEASSPCFQPNCLFLCCSLVDEWVGYERRAPLYRGATRFIKSFLFWFHSTSLLSVWFAPAKTSQPKEISLFFFNETAEGGMREEEENGPGGETHNQLPANWKSLIFIEGPGQTQLFFPLIPQKLHEWEEKF